MPIFVVFVSIGCSISNDPTRAPTPKPASQSTPTPLVENVVPDAPGASRQPIHYQTIDERTKIADIGRLRDLALSADDIEVRIWGGFGKTGVEGFVLRRYDQVWSAYQFVYERTAEGKPGYITKPKEPLSGWDLTWRSLIESKILTLPNARSIGCDGEFLDGFSYVVEIRNGTNYRTYHYGNPMEAFTNRCKEADAILAIAKTINQEFGMPRFEYEQHR